MIQRLRWIFLQSFQSNFIEQEAFTTTSAK
jgi:hypothetical protein